MATEEVKGTFSGNLNDLNFLQGSIEIYTNYLQINIIYDLELSEIYENCLSELHQTDRHLKYEVQLVKEKMERNKDWIENYSKILSLQQIQIYQLGLQYLRMPIIYLKNRLMIITKKLTTQIGIIIRGIERRTTF